MCDDDDEQPDLVSDSQRRLSISWRCFSFCQDVLPGQAVVQQEICDPIAPDLAADQTENELHSPGHACDTRPPRMDDCLDLELQAFLRCLDG